uniref:(northern house mosquito) hypothetical protein n=1 Tax=Culex pipiens TaxID=7175 RepID=A0A8D8MMP4_CULPI
MPKRKHSTRSRSGAKRPSFDLPLPPELLERIFLNLEFKELLQARRTCRRWRDAIASCPELRDRFLLQFPHDRAITKINRNYKPLGDFPAANVEFKLADYSKIGSINAWWPRVACTVTCLAMRGCEFAVDVLRHVPNLKSLELDSVRIGGVGRVDFKLKNLRKLVLKEARPGPLRGMIVRLEVLECRSEVEDLEDLRSIVGLIKSAQTSLVELILDVPASYLKDIAQLTEMRLKKVNLNAFASRMTYGATLIPFAEAYTSIEDLTIVDSLDEEPLHTMLRSQSNLKRLELKFASPIIDYNEDQELNTLPAIPTGLSTLEHLRIECVDDSGWPKLNFQRGCRFPKLKQLHLEALVVKGESLRRSLRYSPNLTQLTLDSCDFTSWNQLLRVITQPKALRSLSFTTYEVMKTLEEEPISAKPCKSLRYLQLNVPELDEVPRARVFALFRLFPHLTELRIESGVNDELVKEVCRKLTRLERLTLRVGSTTHRAVLYIRHYCRNLKYLTLMGIWKLEVEDMHYFVQKLDRFSHGRFEFVGELRNLILDCVKLNESDSDSDVDLF